MRQPGAGPSGDEEDDMVTIITKVTLREGTEPKWDGIMQERLEAAREQPGWVGAHILVPVDAGNQRVIVGCWESRADWEVWHADETFQQTRTQLDGLEAGPGEETWHEVIAEEHEA
jgi:heme-degrading monooxygenase HmoA